MPFCAAASAEPSLLVLGDAAAEVDGSAGVAMPGVSVRLEVGEGL